MSKFIRWKIDPRIDSWVEGEISLRQYKTIKGWVEAYLKMDVDNIVKRAYNNETVIYASIVEHA